jgi:hypothetical protein
MEMHYATLLEALADELGPADAIVFGDKRQSWTELDEIDRAAESGKTFREIDGRRSRGPNGKPDYRCAREAVEHENR